MTKKKILIATGGTGGHVFPAYSLSNYLSNNNFNVKLTTDNRGFKFLKNYKNINLIKIPSSPLIKKNFFSILFSIFTIFFSIIKSMIILIFDRPKIIFGMGGYSSFPICFAAFILRINFIIYENNLIIGKANKYLLPFSKKIFVSFKDLEGVSKKYNNKIVEIGNIIREDILNFRSVINDRDKFDELKILVLGGSQAAKVFAVELPQIFKKLKDNYIPIKVFQQCQKEQINQLSNYYINAKIEHELFNFTDRIIDYYSKSNLVVTRAGASVLGELINFNVPFISIPLPSSADNHQYKNARFYEQKGYGYLLEEKEIQNKLYSIIKAVFTDKSILKKILFNQRQYSDKEIFKTLNTQIEKILDEKN